ncbi:MULTISPECIES: winged helix-turn-helix domain-containing protein [unclassified Micromonospora]|uniref:AfsR/SARP family transcriptional regulator n=1 Tax=unclassified Micromonospora TaxID=2617518 RepID=UPI003632FF3D
MLAGIRCGKEQPVRFRILGTLEFIGATRRLSFAPRQRIVLSMLLLQPNRAVSVERPVDAVWGTASPLTAREQIQICVSAIRRTLAAGGNSGAIVTRPPVTRSGVSYGSWT